jgi:hypothetical protein
MFRLATRKVAGGAWALAVSAQTAPPAQPCEEKR